MDGPPLRCQAEGCNEIVPPKPPGKKGPQPLYCDSTCQRLQFKAQPATETRPCQAADCPEFLPANARSDQKYHTVQCGDNERKRLVPRPACPHPDCDGRTFCNQKSLEQHIESIHEAPEGPKPLPVYDPVKHDEVHIDHQHGWIDFRLDGVLVDRTRLMPFFSKIRQPSPLLLPEEILLLP